MIRAKFRPGQLYDELFGKVIDTVASRIDEKDDDAILVATGLPGTGKTSLQMHGYERYDPDGATVDQIALTRPDFATSLKNAKDSSGRRYCCYDEANINKRDALTRWNKQVIDLYLAIRGLRIFHWWNNPSLDYLDKPFIEERIKGVIFIYTKHKNKPRLYYYFRKKDILALLEKAGDLKHKTLKKYGRKFAYYRGWFLPYNGRLWEPYLLKKQERMSEKVEAFFEEYGGSLMARGELAKVEGVTTRTVENWEAGALRDGFITEADLKVNGGGRVFYTLAAQTGIRAYKSQLQHGAKKKAEVSV